MRIQTAGAVAWHQEKGSVMHDVDTAVLQIPPHAFEMTDRTFPARVFEIASVIKIRLAHQVTL
jgi:hypothetical protein